MTALTVTTRDPQERFALEPTRMSSQTFMIALPDAATLADGTRSASPAAAKVQQRPPDDLRSAALPLGDKRLESTEEAVSSAAHDAAILGWAAADQPSLDGLLLNEHLEPVVLIQRGAIPDSGEQSADDETGTLQAAFGSLNNRKYVIGALVAELAVASLWLQNSAKAEKDPQQLAQLPTTKQGPDDRLRREPMGPGRLRE